MRKLMLPLLLASAAGLAGCMTYADEVAAYQQCGTYGMVDRNNDGFIEASEWNSYRTAGYSYWDANRDGRISQAEFQNCWYGGGFYNASAYNRDYWSQYWGLFDADRDGYLEADEYWSAAAWNQLDRNRNGRIDADEYRWWP